MKLLNIIDNEQSRLGVLTGQGVLDIKAALSDSSNERIPTTVQEVLEGGDSSLAALRVFVDEALASSDKYRAFFREESGLTLGSCVTHPNKIICIGLNYRKHAEETKTDIPEFPILFNKFNNTLAGHGESIPLPRVTQKVDYEAELVIVIGKKAKYVSKEDALSHVFGYCNVNDLSARDLQLRTSQWLTGKSY